MLILRFKLRRPEPVRSTMSRVFFNIQEPMCCFVLHRLALSLSSCSRRSNCTTCIHTRHGFFAMAGFTVASALSFSCCSSAGSNACKTQNIPIASQLYKPVLRAQNKSCVVSRPCFFPPVVAGNLLPEVCGSLLRHSTRHLACVLILRFNSGGQNPCEVP